MQPSPAVFLNADCTGTSTCNLERIWSCSPVMSTLCWCGPAACGGRSPSRGPTLWPWSRRHRWPPAARRTGRSEPPPRGPWGRVNTDLSQCPRRAAWRHESHWPPWGETRMYKSGCGTNILKSCEINRSLDVELHFPTGETFSVL